VRRPTLVFGELLQDLDSKRGRFLSYLLYFLSFVFLLLYVVGTFDFVRPYQGVLVWVEFVLALVFLF
jgi:hypothetical protein